MTINKDMQNTSDMKYVIIMKVGYHTDESLDEIITRKKVEDIKGSFFFWGYGGTVCHPKNQVQHFASEASLSGEKIHLLMTLTPSKFKATPNVSTHYSIDSLNWFAIPDYALVTGSKYALICTELRSVDISINLNNYKVGVGPKFGTPAIDYLQRRVDKVCGIYEPRIINKKHLTNSLIQIKYITEIVSPYAVFLRSDGLNGKKDEQQQLF
jgi:hypothetical protein